MSHGETPILKRMKGSMTRAYHCESCDRQMKTKNRCEWHTNKEPCYYCHLIIHHFNNGDKTKENSPKKSLTLKA